MAKKFLKKSNGKIYKDPIANKAIVVDTLKVCENPQTVATEDEMTALLTSENVGKVFKYVGEGGGAAVGGTENPTAIGDTVTQVYFDTSKSAEEVYNLLANATFDFTTEGFSVATLFGTEAWESDANPTGQVVYAVADIDENGNKLHYIINESDEHMLWAYSPTTDASVIEAESWGWQKSSPYTVAEQFTIAYMSNKDIWGSFLSAHENGFASGSASKYEKDALYLIAAGGGSGGSSTNAPIAVGDTIDKLYFNTSVEPDFSGLTYDKDGCAILVCGNDHLGLGVFDLAQLGREGGGYAILCNDEFFLYATEDISDFVSEIFETPMTVPKGWNPAYIIDGAFTLPSPDTISEVNQQDAWSGYMSKEPFVSGAEVIVASELNVTSGSLLITENGTYDIAKMASVEVNVASTSKLPLVVGYQDTSNPYDITATDLEGVTEIRRYAFYSCKGLNSVTLPSTCTNIENSAFGSCSALTSVDMPNVTSIESSAFNWCSALTSVDMPNVTNIENSAFSWCSALTALTIPSTCTSIYDSALQCGSSTNKCTFTFEGTTPPSITSSTFASTYINKIIVPAGYGETYKTATNWAIFADYIEEATE